MMVSTRRCVLEVAFAEDLFRSEAGVHGLVFFSDGSALRFVVPHDTALAVLLTPYESVN